jgi:hypothetical protein
MTDGGFRVLVAGADSWSDGFTVFRVLNEILTEQGTPLTVILGNTVKGAGQITRMWCQVHPQGMIDMKARPGWSARLLAERARPHLVVAFLTPCRAGGCPQRGLHWDHGPGECAEYARAAGIKVRTLEAVMV